MKKWLLLIALLSMFGGCRRAAPRTSSPIADDPSLVVADSVRANLINAGRQVLFITLADVRDTATVCVAFIEGGTPYRASPSELHELSDSHVRVVARTACPRTYVNMIYTGEKAPPGYVDPRYLELVIPGGKAREREVLEVHVVQGTSTDIYTCRMPPAGKRGFPVCRLVSSWVG